MELDFGPYRERAQALQMSPESAERIRQRLREECAKQAAIEAEQNLSIRSIPLVSKAATPPAPRRKHRTALKVAACLVICLGIGLLSVPVFQSLSDSPATAGAGIPSRPPQRIEFTHYGIIVPTDPSFDENNPYDPSDIFGCRLDIQLFLPAFEGDMVQVTLIGSDKYKLFPAESDIFIEDLISDQNAYQVSSQREDAFAFCIAGTIPMNASSYERCIQRGVGGNRECAQFIEGLEDVRLVIEGQDGASTYRIDFSTSPSQQAVELQMAHSAYRPIMLKLIQEGE